MEIYVYRNGERSAGPFQRLADADEHAKNMQRISVNLKRYRDKWHVVCEENEHEHKQVISDKEKRAIERRQKMNAEIRKSREQLRRRAYK